MFLRRTILTLGSPCLILACGDDGVSPRDTQSRIEILPENVASLDLGLTDTVRLSARRLDKHGAPLTNDSLIHFLWQSSDTTVLIVDTYGLVEVVGLGTATISARISDTVSILFPHPTDTAVATVELTGRPDVIHEGPLLTASTWGFHQCVVLATLQAQCRGQNDRGQLGTGDAVFRSSWTPVAAQIGFSSIWTTFNHTCGLSADGRAYCWGSNRYGQLGNGRTSTQPSPLPTEVSGNYRWRWLVASGHSQTCGITTDEIPLCFGHNDLGQVGREPTLGIDSVIGEFGSGHRMTMMDSDHAFTCGVRTDGAIYCSGPISSPPPLFGMPARVSGPITFRSVAVGSYHGCGLDPLGSAHCWGLNDTGQLGDGTVGNPTLSAVPVTGGHIFARIYAFDWTTCGVTTVGDTMCWGSNRGGGLGRTRISQSSVPIPLGIGKGAHSIDRYGDGGRACAVDGERRLVCWGGVPVDGTRFGGNPGVRPSRERSRLTGTSASDRGVGPRLHGTASCVLPTPPAPGATPPAC